MKRILAICISALVFSISTSAQTTSPKETINAFLNSNPLHKIYVQTDRQNYMSGDDIFFKAYIVNPGSYAPWMWEHILYVEIYTPKGTLESKQMFLIQDGVASGQITLSQALSWGEYSLVAYTNTLRNYDKNAAFAHKFKILDDTENNANIGFTTEVTHLENGDSVYVNIQLDLDQMNRGEAIAINASMELADESSLESKLSVVAQNKGRIKLFVPKKDMPENPLLQVAVENGNVYINKSIPLQLSIANPDVQFLPEGGNLYAGIKNKVAVKSIDVNGFPMRYTGNVLDNTGKKISSFEAQRDGISFFEITPTANTQYQVEIISQNNDKYKFDLPIAENKGVALSAKLQSDFSYAIQVSPVAEELSSLQCVAYTSKEVYFSKELETNKINNFIIPENTLPVGVSRILIIANGNIPIAERMLFRYPNKTVNVQIDSDKPNYGQRELVRLGLVIPAMNTDFNWAEMALSVTEKDDNPSINSENIFSYLLLNSELKGKIANPGWYVANKTIEKAQALDLVLLTNGWSKFDMSSILASKNEELTFTRDSLIYIKGKLRNNITRIPLNNYNIKANLSKNGKSASVMLTTSSDGNFNLSVPNFYDKYNYNLFIGNKNNQLKDVILEVETPLYSQELDLIKLIQETKFDKKLFGIPNNIPSAQEWKSSNTAHSNLTINSNTKTGINRTPRKDVYFSPGGDTVSLPAVNIVKKKYTNMRASLSLTYGQPDVIIEAAAIRKLAEKQKRYSNIWDLVLDEIPGLRYYEEFLPSKDIASGGNPMERARLLDRAYKNNALILWPDQSSKLGETDAMVLFLFDVSLIYVNNKVTQYIYDLNHIDPKDVIAVEYIDSPGKINYADLMDADMIEPETSYNENAGFKDSKQLVSAYGMKNSIIAITTRPGAGTGSASKGVYSGTLEGFTKYREFYVPNYAQKETMDSVVRDTRKTIYWNPKLKLQVNESKQMSFYSTDSENDMTLVLQGITNTGIPFYATKTLAATPAKPINAEEVTPLEDKSYLAFKNAKPKSKLPKTLHFKIVDKAQKTPVNFASIAIINDSYGQITNADGESELSIRPDFAGLSIFAPGYENIELKSSAIHSDSLLVELSEGGLMPLEAGDTDNGLDLMKVVLRKIDKNYPTNIANTAFYSEKVYLNNWICALNESILTYSCSSTSKGDMESKLEWKKHRSFKTFDYREKLKFEPNHNKNVYVLNSDVVNYRKPFLINDFLDNYDYTIQGKTNIDGKTCYVVHFDQKNNVVKALQKGHLYIDSETYAVVHAKWMLSPKGLDYITYLDLVHSNYNYDLLEANSTLYEAHYNQNADDEWTLLACREILDFTVNRSYSIKFDKTLLVNYSTTTKELTIKNNNFNDLQTLIWLIKTPVYTDDFWRRYIPIKPDQEIIDNMKFLHEETLYMGR